MTPTQIQDALRAALEKLPDDPADIAQTFAEMGVKGVPGHACACPVARYLRRVTDLPAMYVSDLFALGYAENGAGATWAMPSAVMTFVDDFDDGKYPELVDPDGLTREEKWEEEDDGYEPL